MIGHSDTVRCIEQLSEEEIISGSEDRTIKIWNLSTGDCLKTFGDYEYRIFSINIISSDTIVSSANYEKVKVWDLNTGECLKTITIEETTNFYKIISVWDSIFIKKFFF